MKPSPESPSLAPIPIPLRRRWREFRIRVLPAVTFFVAGAVAVSIWRSQLGAPTLEGQADAVVAAVSSPEAGSLTQLRVARFQSVREGEAVAVILPNASGAPLTLIRAEIELLRARLDPVLGRQQNATDSERLRLEWLVQRADLAEARVELARAENALTRDETLFKSQVISADLYDASLKARDGLQAVVTEKQRLVDEIQQGLDRLRGLGETEPSTSAADATIALFKLQETRLKALEQSLQVITLFAPIDGMVSAVHHQTGENITDGDPIVSIAATKSTQIIGYLRQPFPVEPHVGMAVEVRTRSRPQRVASAQVAHIGAQMEQMTNGMMLARNDRPLEFGLPIAFGLPAELNLRPGEVVDLVLRP